MTEARPSTAAPRSRRRTFAIIGALLAVGAGAMAMYRSTRAKPEVTTERSTPWLEEGFIHYPQQFADREKITVTEVKLGLVAPKIEATGTIENDARLIGAIGARITGRLRSVRKVVGDTVEPGEIVAELESAELGRAQADVLKARAREKVARVDAQRERSLADAKVSPERDAQFAQANLEALSAERVAAERTVQALGGVPSMDNEEIGVLRLKSPLKGRVITAKAQAGQTVEPRDTLFTIADMSRLWAELNVFERDLGAVRIGDSVDLRFPAVPGEILKGKVAHIGEVLDERTRAATVRVVIDNNGTLRLGLSVIATIHGSGRQQELLKVPRSSVVHVDGKPTVFVLMEERVVDPRSVTLGPEDAISVSVMKGLEAGEKVVNHGVLALKAEVFR